MGFLGFRRQLPAEDSLLELVEQRPASIPDPHYHIAVEVNGVTHWFVKDQEGNPSGHSSECMQAHRDGLACGCQTIPYSGGRSPHCSKYVRLIEELGYVRGKVAAQKFETPDEQEHAHETIRQAQRNLHRHTCTCGAYDRPEKRPANVTPNGHRTDAQNVVLRSHPDCPGSLPKHLEGAWTSTNPAWPEWSINSYMQRWAPKCEVDWGSCSKDNTETDSVDGTVGIVIYVRPLSEKPSEKTETIVHLPPD